MDSGGGQSSDMKALKEPVYLAAGSHTIFMGSGRKEFDPEKPMKPFEEYLLETARGTCSQMEKPDFDEGVIGSFMSARFLNQANLPGFLPFMTQSLSGKPCTGVEGACGTGGRALAIGIASILSGLSDSVFIAGFEMQNTLKLVYGADVLAGAAYYKKERKSGAAHFFPGIFAARAGAYYEKYGYERTRKGMAKWYEQSILHARKNPHAQEYHNRAENLYELGMSPPNPEKFVPFLNYYDCSKVSDGAASLGVFSEEGLKRCGIRKEAAVQAVGIGAAQADITLPPEDLTALTTTSIAVRKALDMAGISKEELGVLEVHDCFTITGLLALEAIGFAPRGQAADFIMEGQAGLHGTIPTNLSGGLGGFGHPTGATGVRQMVDLVRQLTQNADNQAPLKKEFGMMISMGGNDKTVTCLIVKKAAH